LWDEVRVRILSITGGAGGMYCGSCLRDNALAAELLKRGHEVTLLPLYTPTLTDEQNVSRPEVLFGGISVYLKQRYPLFRALPRSFDWLLDRPSVIKAFADRSVSTDPKVLGALTVSMLEGTTGVLATEYQKLLDWLKDEPVPDVVSLPYSLLIGMARPLREALERPVCCTLQGEDLFIDGLVEPYRTRTLDLIRGHVRHVDRFIAVSGFCRDAMSRQLQIPPGRISVVPIGVKASSFTPTARPGHELFRVGYFARVAPEKGLHVLAEAFTTFAQRVGGAPVRLDAAGYLASSCQPYLADVERSIGRAGLSSRFTYHGPLDHAGKIAFLQAVHVFSMPATYDEPKGFPLLEAMATGVPVVQPRRGAFTEIVECTGGGLLVDAGPNALAEGLYALWSDRARRETLGNAAAAGVRAHYTVEQSADRLLEVFSDLARATADRRAS
jgi:glycosyltransferase involved in cell wall biosynthesis